MAGLLILMVQTLACAAPAPADYLIDQWTSDDDLPDTSVTAIARTADGYIWVGTYNGLARFDGLRFVSFDPFNTPALKRARVTGLFVDRQGTLWINTYDGSMTSWRNGLFTCEWQGGQVSRVFTRSNEVIFALESGQMVVREETPAPDHDWRTISLAGPAVGNCFQQDENGALWYLLRDGRPGRVTETNVEIFSGDGTGLDHEKVSYLTADKHGRIWVGTDRGIRVWDGRRFENETPTNGEPDVNVSFLFCTDSNGCWVFGDGKVRKCENRQWVTDAPSWTDLAKASPDSLAAAEDRFGGVWFRHFGLGLFHAGPDGRPQRISTANGLPADRINCWLQGPEGNLWLGANPGGLVCLRRKQFQVIGEQEGLTNPAVATICEDVNSNVWIGTFGGGLNRLRDGGLKRFDLPAGINKGFFFSAYPDPQGRLWLSAGNEDLFQLQNGLITPASNPVNGITATLVDRQGRVWLGTQNGLECLTNGVLEKFATADGIQNKIIRSLAQDRQGAIWIGTRFGDLYQYQDGKFTLYRATDGLQNQALCSLLPGDDGTLWIGTFRGGLLRFKNGTFTRYTVRDGLRSDIIYQVLDDGLGKLWMGSHDGIFYVPKDSLANFDQRRIQSLPCVCFGQYDGLPTRECSGKYQPSCWRGHDGTLWFATLNGAVGIRPDKISINLVPPQVVIEEIYLDGKLYADNLHPVIPSQMPNPGAAPVILGLAPGMTFQIPPGRHQLEFRYTALSYSAPDGVRFRYKLAGLDDGWVEAGPKRFADYGPLPPGKYHFQVIAGNSGAVWNEQGSTINLKVLPFFWQTWWFDGVLGLLAMSIVFGTVRFVSTRRLRRQLEKAERERAIELDRERIAKDIHDDLGAGLTQIMLQCSLARREPQEKSPAHLAQISDTARELVRAMDEIVWAVNPENDTLEGLINYIGKFTHDYLSLAGIRCRLDLPAELPAMNLSAEVRHNLFLAVKEVLNNAVKHAQATEVSLQLKLLPDRFTLIIQDNGLGFASRTTAEIPAQGSRISSGSGLRNLTKRLQAIGGSCTVRSGPQSGTQVELTFTR